MVVRARSDRFTRKPITSLQLALIIVAVAAIGAIGWRDATADRPLPLISAPLMPPWWLVYVFSGGPHSSIGPYEEAQATLLVAVPFWWAIIAAGRAGWSWLRRNQAARAH
jgi:hypothetical protein